MLAFAFKLILDPGITQEQRTILLQLEFVNRKMDWIGRNFKEICFGARETSQIWENFDNLEADFSRELGEVLEKWDELIQQPQVNGRPWCSERHRADVLTGATRSSLWSGSPEMKVRRFLKTQVEENQNCEMELLGEESWCLLRRPRRRFINFKMILNKDNRGKCKDEWWGGMGESRKMVRRGIG